MINLGQINFGLGADTRQLQRATQDVVSFGRVVEQAARSTAQGSQQVEAQLRKQEAAAIAALQRVQKFHDAVRKSAADPNLLARTGNAFQGYVNWMTRGQLSALQFQRAQERFNASMNNAQRILKVHNANVANGANSTGAFSAALDRLSSASILVAGPLSGIAARISVLSTLADKTTLTIAGLVVGIAAAGYAFYKMSAISIDATKKMEKIEQTLTAVSGSSAIARTEMEYLMNLADRSGSKFDVVAQQYARMEAAAKGTSVEGERMRNIFESVIFATQKLGSTSEETAGALKAIEQIISKGKISAEELRQQLGDRLPGAVQIMAQALGVSTGKLDEMMRKGNLKLSDLTKFADTLKQRLGIDTTKAIDTTAAAEGRLYNAFIRLGNAMEKVFGFTSAYKTVLGSLVSALDYVSNNMQTLIAVTGGVAGALLGLATPAIISGLVIVANGIRTIALAMIGLNTAALANPLTGLLTVLWRVALAIGGAIIGFQAFTRLMQTSSGNIDQARKSVKDYIEAQTTLKSTIRQTTEEYIKQQEVFLQGNLLSIDKLEQQLKQQEALLQSYRDMPQDPYSSWAQQEGLTQAQVAIDALRLKIVALRAEAGDAGADLAKLYDILRRQTKAENNPKKDDDKELSTRQTVAIKNANDTIRELMQQRKILFMGDSEKRWAEVQLEVNKKVEDFRDTLTRAELPLAKVTELTNKYRNALKGLKETELTLARTTTLFQFLKDVIGKGFDTAVDQFVTGIMEGKSALETLRNTAKIVTADILKTLLQLAVANPLKNWMFGMDTPTLGLGKQGMGGFLGMLMGGSTSATPAVADAWAGLRGITAHTGGRAGALATRMLPKFHTGKTGLAPNETRAVIKKDEWVLTSQQMKNMSRRQQGRGNTYIYNNTNSHVSSKTNSNGDLEVMIDSKIDQRLRGPHGRQIMAGQYGVKPSLKGRAS